MALYRNLRKANRRWGMVAKLMGKIRVPIKARVVMYRAVVQTVLMYGGEIWVVT